MPAIERRFAVGAEVVANRGVHFRVWAPDKSRVQVVIESSRSAMQWSLTEEEGGYWSGFVEHAKAGDRYRYKLDDSTMLYPDPASRFQPEGPHRPSQIVDATGFVWTDENWEGISHNRVIYEMHIGTFTAAGTYRAAIEELAELADLGVTVIEIMPLAEFDGKFGWGYDGVDIFAPCHHYGTPDDLRSFVNEAHRLGMAVILDVVYNHCGASGSYFRQFSRDYFSSKYKGDWGDVFNFDGDNSAALREFICANAAYWVEEFHFDGFRLDATQQIFDESPRHILLDLLAAARQRSNGRALYVVAENEPQHSALVRSLEDGGFGMQGIVNDDFHHSAMVALKGHREAYFHDYLGRPQEFISAAKYGFLYQGQWYAWQKQNRGAPTYGVMQDAFIHFLQNHDQIANTGDGTRQDALAPPEMGLPVWHYEINGLVLEKRLFMPYQQNTVHVCYRVISATEPVRLELRPALHYRALEAAVDKNPVAETDYVLSVREDYFKLTGGNFPPLYLKTHGGEATFTIDWRRSEDIFYRLESFRGYAAVGQYWTPGAFAMTLGTTGELTFTCSTEKPETLRLVAPEEAYELEVKRRFQLLAIAETPVDSGMPAELVLAADQFIVTPAGRAEEAARAKASGEEVKTIIAGYHWFTDWGRDTMISLEGSGAITKRAISCAPSLIT